MSRNQIEALLRKGLNEGSEAHMQEAFSMIQKANPQFDVGAKNLSRGNAYGQTGPRTEPGRQRRINPFGARGYLTPARAAIVQSYLAPTRIITVPDIPAIAPGGVSPGERLQFQGGAGWLWGWRGSIVAPLAAAGGFQEAMSSIFVEMNIDGRSDKVTDGRTESRASFDGLFGTISGVPYAPLRIYLNQRDTLNFIFENRHPVIAYTPDLTLAFIDDPHMALADLLWCDPAEYEAAMAVGTTR